MPFNNTWKAIDFLVFWGHQQKSCSLIIISLKFPPKLTENSILKCVISTININILLISSSTIWGFFISLSLSRMFVDSITVTLNKEKKNKRNTGKNNFVCSFFSVSHIIIFNCLSLTCLNNFLGFFLFILFSFLFFQSIMGSLRTISTTPNCQSNTQQIHMNNVSLNPDLIYSYFLLFLIFGCL